MNNSESPVGQNPSDNPFATHPDNDPRPFRFGLLSLMMSMLVFAIIGVGLNQLVRVVRQGTTPKAAFALATLVAPVLLVTLISAVRAITTTLQQLQSKHPPED